MRDAGTTSEGASWGRVHPELRTKYAGVADAQRYRLLHAGRARHQREARCVADLLRDLPRGSRVLDLPCGTGRMFPVLTTLGFDVYGADFSRAMVDLAREDVVGHAESDESAGSGGVRDVLTADVFAMPFEDGGFDAVLCNRFLHHLGDSERRVAALRELRRVSRGPVVASFFCTRSWDAQRARRRGRRAGPRSDRTRMSPLAFERDLADAGLRVARIRRTLPWISQQWYLKAVSL